MINQTIKKVEKVLNQYQNPVVAFSGGKDGFCVAHICNQVRPNINMVCETSFYFKQQLANIKEIAQRHNFNVTYKDSLSNEWLLKHKNIIFSNDAKLRSFSFSKRQQTTVKKFAKQFNADLIVYGRRSDENSVKAELYETKAGMQFHPIRSWKESDVWAYFKHIGEPKPWIYNTRFGYNMGNAPFYSLKRGNMTINECWDIINEIDLDRTFYNQFK